MMDSAHPEAVFIRDRADETVAKRHSLLRVEDTCSIDGFPEVIKPAGLSSARQWYLCEKIREVNWSNVQLEEGV